MSYFKGIRYFKRGKPVASDKIDGRHKGIKAYFYDGAGNRFEISGRRIYKKEMKAFKKDIWFEVRKGVKVKMKRFETKFKIFPKKVKRVKMRLPAIKIKPVKTYINRFGKTGYFSEETLAPSMLEEKHIMKLVKSYFFVLKNMNCTSFYFGLVGHADQLKGIWAEFSKLDVHLAETFAEFYDYYLDLVRTLINNAIIKMSSNKYNMETVELSFIIRGTQ